jgi:TatA/E family protein of Tat protein translocase
MWGLSLQHWVIVVGVVALLFGMNRLPHVMRDLGKSVKEIRKIPDALTGDDDGA